MTTKIKIKIEREIITPRKNYSLIHSNSASDINSSILNKSKVIINNSSSKAMYSFPLSKRFPDYEVDNSQFFFEKSSTLSQRKTSIGYGKRSTIVLSKRGKTDMYYNIPPTINANSKSGSPKYTFGFSREICRYPKCLDERKTPGPMNYFPYKNFGQNGVKYSMSFRYKYKKDPDNFPGPGTYEIPGLNKKGIYSNSNHRNIQCAKFARTKRFKQPDWVTPGPGAYNFENLIKGNGVIYNSKFISDGAKTFGKKLKWIRDKLVTPGPGAYESFSEFQGFDTKNYIKIRKNYTYEKNKGKKSINSRATSALTRRTWI